VSGLDSQKLNYLKELAITIGIGSNVEIFVHQRPSDYYKLLSTSDLAIVAGGLTAFDCAHAGVPSIAIPQYEHQLENIKRLEKLGCLKLAAREMELDSQGICNLVADLSANYEQRLAMSQAGSKVIDGQGLDRVIDLIAKTYDRG
jgi:spore coat polysaccharide biosynthesis predicted glycosyltransferase SpsG